MRKHLEIRRDILVVGIELKGGEQADRLSLYNRSEVNLGYCDNVHSLCLEMKKEFYSGDHYQVELDKNGVGISLYDLALQPTIDPETKITYPAWDDTYFQDITK